MRAFILIAATGIACAISRHVNLRRYFAAQFLNSFAGYLAFAEWGETSHLYAAAFIAGEVLVICSMVPLVYRSLYYHGNRGMAILVGMCCGAALAWRSTWGQSLGFYEWLGMVDGGLLVAMGLMAGMGAAYLQRNARMMAMMLMLMWLGLAAFRLGFTSNFNSAAWNVLNEWLPMAIVSIGCLGLAKLDRA